MNKKKQPLRNAKNTDLAAFGEDGGEQFLTTDHGVRIEDDRYSLKADERGPTPRDFTNAIARHRRWSRETKTQNVPA